MFDLQDHVWGDFACLLFLFEFWLFVFGFWHLLGIWVLGFGACRTSGFDRFLRGIGEIVGRDKLDAAFFEESLSFLDVRPFESDHDRNAEVNRLRGADNSL